MRKAQGKEYNSCIVICTHKNIKTFLTILHIDFDQISKFEKLGMNIKKLGKTDEI